MGRVAETWIRNRILRRQRSCSLFAVLRKITNRRGRDVQKDIFRGGNISFLCSPSFFYHSDCLLCIILSLSGLGSTASTLSFQACHGISSRHPSLIFLPNWPSNSRFGPGNAFLRPVWPSNHRFGPGNAFLWPVWPSNPRFGPGNAHLRPVRLGCGNLRVEYVVI